MKIVVSGGSGFIGAALLEALSAANHEVVCLSRSGSADKAVLPHVRYEGWDGSEQGTWVSAVDGADAVVNLAGASLSERWTAAHKKRILESRIGTTRSIVEAIRRVQRRPAVLINGSAVGYYGNVESGDVTEKHPKGEGFLAEVCDRWETEAQGVRSLGVRLVVLRTAPVLDTGSIVLKRMSLPFQLFVGGPVGSGNQWFPWVHRRDVVGVILESLTNAGLSGPVNVAAPDSVTMKQFCIALGKALGRPCWAPPVPGPVLRAVLGEMASMVLTGQKVVPELLRQHEYRFTFARLDRALADAVK
jgi:uncharacterized protein (TIGR01777 family)